MGIFNRKKLKKLNLPAKDKQVLKESDVFEDLISEEHELLAEMEEATVNLWNAATNFSRALNRLNTVNAQLNRGPVDIEDELLYHCVKQETLNQRYADINARHHAKLEQRLQNMPDPTENEKQQ